MRKQGWFILFILTDSLKQSQLVISEQFFAGAYFRLDFAAIRRKKFAAHYFWFKAKLKQKKFIFK